MPRRRALTEAQLENLLALPIAEPALAHLLGFHFAPRIPNLADRKLYAFGPASTWPALAPFIAGRPDDKLITAQWDDVLRLTTSVRTGTVSASLLLKRLGSRSCNTRSNFACISCGSSPISSRKIVPPLAVLKKSRFGFHRTGERAFFVPEELAFHQV